MSLPATISGLIEPGSRVLLDGEPCVVLGPDDDYPGSWLVSRPQGWDVLNDTTWCRSAEAAELTLDLSHVASRDRCVRWAAEGERCIGCSGTGSMPKPLECHGCAGTGYRRKPHDLRDFSDISGKFTPEQSAAALAWCVRSIAAGGLPLEGVLGEWCRDDLSPNTERWARPAVVHRATAYARAMLPEGAHSAWGFRPHPSSTTHFGPETGPEGRACADRAALAARYALLDGGALVLPPDTDTPAKGPGGVE